MKSLAFSQLLISTLLITSSDLFHDHIHKTSANNITFYNYMREEEYSTVVNECFSISSLPDPELSYEYLEVETDGLCITLYNQLNCTGDYIALDSNHPLAGRQIPLAERSWWGQRLWESGIQTPEDKDGSTTTTITPLPCSHSAMPFKSIGPCLEKCDLRNIEKDLGQGLNVTVYKSFFFNDASRSALRRIQPNTLVLHYGECIAFSTALKRRVGEIRMDWGAEQACIELHKRSDCSGDFIKLRRNLHHTFTSMVHRSNGVANEAIAVSLCGYQCLNKTRNETHSNEPAIPQNAIRIYDDVDYLGNFTDIDVTPNCVNITDEWEDQTRSVKVNGHCVVLYDALGCDETAKSVQIGESGSYDRSVLFKNINAFPTQIRSAGRCSSSSSDKNESTVSTSTTPSIPVTLSVKVNGSDNGTAEKSVSNVNPNGNESSSSSSGVATVLLYFSVILITLSLVSVGVVVLEKKYSVGSRVLRAVAGLAGFHRMQ